MMVTDYYRVLGVMPGADEVVVRAAYKALAQRYHPDRFAGDPAEANRRMAEINAAFAILGDPVKRAAYDAERTDYQTADFAASDDEHQQDQAFSDALEEMERRWGVACGIFPDLEDLKQQLHRISSRLSFAFVMTVLESKNFNDRKEIAKHLERDFLRRYFGENDTIQSFAKDLIMGKERDAARTLNDLIGVMGADVDSALLVRRIEIDFGLREKQEQRREEEERRRICESLRTFDSVGAAMQLADMAGFVVNLKGLGFFKDYTYVVESKGRFTKDAMEFHGDDAFIKWVRTALCKP